ncbi:MtrAB system histidine kinase MtrB [Demequina flava]|uniref:MtrAB system histidine kinase MtrB n=1 Tax=Demequina flava TaxID=1095025 RepID=UPI0007816AF6|nr:MtrAB system histidine kinase MtrB [Demequina flava]
MTEATRSVAGAIVAPLRSAARRWSRSLSLRIITSTLVVGIGAVLALGAYVTSEIRDGLVDDRVERVLSESARDATIAQQRAETTTAANPAEMQTFVYELLIELSTLGGDNRGLVMMRSPDNTSSVPLTVGESSTDLRFAVSPEMREAVDSGVAQPWQFVELPGTDTPGIVVGSSLDLGIAGPYELYFVYSMADEQATLELIQRVLALGGVVLVLLVLAMTWFVTTQAVRPVRRASRVAARLAEGRLSERMTVRGHDEMATLAQTFNEMAESLQRQITRMERMSRLQRRFVSDVSHELRTPLTTIRMASDVLYDSRADFPPAVARSSELLSAQLDRFEALLADLLEISRIDAGSAQLEFESMDVADLVRDEVEAMLPVAADMGVPIRLRIAEGAHTASIDRPRVGRIVRNLLSNAVEHAQDTRVDVSVRSDRRSTAVVVRDFGVGLTPQQVDRVFDRFWRADSARARTLGGTGLGLSIALEDAQLHGGELEVWGSPGQGASFRLLLPRTHEGIGTNQPLPLVMRQGAFEEVGPEVDFIAAGFDNEVMAPEHEATTRNEDGDE